jgi:hypothetical protein
MVVNSRLFGLKKNITLRILILGLFFNTRFLITKQFDMTGFHIFRLTL